MRNAGIFLLSIVVGALVALAYARFTGQGAESVRSASTGKQRPGAGARRKKAGAVTPPSHASPAAPTAAAKPSIAPPASTKPAAPTPPPKPQIPAPASAPTAVETAQATAAKAAAAETLNREQLQTMISAALAGKLSDRELTSSDYARLTDAVLRIRASERVLQAIPESDPGASVRALHADVLRAAFAEVTSITGVPPAALGDVLAGGEV